MSASPSNTSTDIPSALEALLDQVESTLDSAEPEALFTMAQHQADLLARLKKSAVTLENAPALTRTLNRSRAIALRIEKEMERIRARLTTSANKKRITGAYTAP